MKKMLLTMLSLLMLVMSGCGDGTVSVIIPIIPAASPSITSYQFTKDTVAEFIDGSVDFHAPDSDIDTITITVFNSSGFQVARTTIALNLPGVIFGTIPFSIDYATYPADLYTFSIFLTDFNGNTSNQVVDTFSVP